MEKFILVKLILALLSVRSYSYELRNHKYSEEIIANPEKYLNSASFCHIKNFTEVQNAVKNCNNIILDSLIVPAGKSLDLNLKDGSVLVFRGKTIFEFKAQFGYLVQIRGNGLRIIGLKGSSLDGQGALYWDGMGSWSNVSKPNLVSYKLQNSVVTGVNLVNCPKLCSGCKHCENVTFENMLVNVTDGLPEIAGVNKSGHNTDGLNLYNSSNIVLRNSTIINQDDCVALTEAINITVENMFCYGGHGLSISQRKGIVENVTFSNSIVEHSENGIHIKTPSYKTEGIIRNVTYRNILIKGATDYGILIQQNYVNQPPNSNSTPPQPSNNIPIYNLNLINVTATTTDSALPLSIVCAEDGCFDWNWSGVKVSGKRVFNNTCVNYKPNNFDDCNLINNTFFELE